MKNLKNLPAIHQLQTDKRFKELLISHHFSEYALTKWLKEEMNALRSKIINNDIKTELLNKNSLTDLIFDKLNQNLNHFENNNLRHVVNATGVILHTNLGRARLSDQAIEQISQTAINYSTLEFDLTTGKRGSRHDLVEDYLKYLTGAEAAMIVNNNAAAVYLVLKAIAAEQEVIVSRGELIEIGGSFRISEIMQESLAKLVDVGTTNKTHLGDYEKAITEETALLMKVHKSNFKILGFSEEVNSEDLLNLSKKHCIPIYEDLGSGTLFNFTDANIGSEPTVIEKVNAGIDLISFSGDKLLGGPQAGIIIGKKAYIEKLKKHQLARVLRVDKFTLAGMEATLKSYLRNQETKEIPTIRDIIDSSDIVLDKAKEFINKITSLTSSYSFEIKPDTAKIGGGTMPEVEIDTFVVQVNHHTDNSTQIINNLRKHDIPIIARVKHERVVLDFRTINKQEINILVEAFRG